MSKAKKTKNEGSTLYISNASDMGQLVTLLTKNGYITKVKEVCNIDCYCAEYKVTFKRISYEEEEYV